MIVILQRKQVYDIMLGSVPRPPGSDSTPAVAEWRERDLMAREQILVGLTNDQVNHVANYCTAAQIWQALTTIHAPTHVHLCWYTISMLYHMRATEDTDITEHLNEMIRIRQILAQHEKPVTDPDFKNILLECLPHSWNPFVSAMLAQEMITKMTITELKTTLSEEYQRCK